MKIPFYDLRQINLRYRSLFQQALDDVLDSGWFILGNQVNDFEKAFAAYCQTKYAVGVGNGLDALYLALKSLGIGAADEVIVPSHTFIATWLAVSMCGAKPVPVEPRMDTYNIDPDKIEEKITKRTKAIIPVHLYGQACEMDAIMRLARRHHLSVVEDNAQAHGAMYNGKITGSFGKVNATSFYPVKNLGALGDGGAVTTNNKAMADYIATFRNYGSGKKYYHEMAGINSRLDELQAAFLLIKLKMLEADRQQRVKVAQQYHAELSGTGDLILPAVAEKATHVYHLFVVRTQYRDKLKKALEQKGIGCMIHYPVPPHMQRAYSSLNFLPEEFAIARKLTGSILSLPIFPGLAEIQVEYICSAIKPFFKQHG